MQAVTKLEGFTKDLDDLFVARDKEYLNILGYPAAAAASGARSPGRHNDAETAEAGGSGPFAASTGVGACLLLLETI